MHRNPLRQTRDPLHRRHSASSRRHLVDLIRLEPQLDNRLNALVEFRASEILPMPISRWEQKW
jgi:hypothetical protein